MIFLVLAFVWLVLIVLLARALPPAHTDWYAFDIRHRHKR